MSNRDYLNTPHDAILGERSVSRQMANQEQSKISKLKAENKRLREALGYLRMPIESALRSEPLHEAGIPSGNVAVEWYTSYHTLHEIIELLES